MSAGIAHLRGYDLRTDEVRSAILVSRLGSAGASVLKRTGVEVGRRSTAAALQKVPGRVLIEINKRIGYRLVGKAGEKGVINLTKLVPLVGGPIGATVDAISCRTIATDAMRTFEPRGRHIQHLHHGSRSVSLSSPLLSRWCAVVAVMPDDAPGRLARSYGKERPCLPPRRGDVRW